MNRPDIAALYKTAFALSMITILYNIIEGLVSAYFGYTDETLALFGFGIDSFIEVISGIGIAHMIIRFRKNDFNRENNFEKTALKITGTSFYLLTAGLTITVIYNIFTQHSPETTFWGIVISLLSIATMYFLMQAKLKVGIELQSQPIISDAGCTKVCLYMSVILLASSGIFELTGISFFDSIGAAGLAFYSFKEGKECFEKAEGGDCSCSCGGDCH
jgi:divalent metal cation (Fe/Co/Zn/Cd) transporter